MIHQETKDIGEDERNSPPPELAGDVASSEFMKIIYVHLYYSLQLLFLLTDSSFSKQTLNVVGDVEGRIAILIVSYCTVVPLLGLSFYFFLFLFQDDVLDEVGSALAAACCLKEKGATEVHLVATHAIMSNTTPQQLQSSCIDQVSTCTCAVYTCTVHVHVDQLFDYTMEIVLTYNPFSRHLLAMD